MKNKTKKDKKEGKKECPADIVPCNYLGIRRGLLP